VALCGKSYGDSFGAVFVGPVASSRRRSTFWIRGQARLGDRLESWIDHARAFCLVPETAFGFEADRNTLKERCPPKYAGITREAQAACPVAPGIRIPDPLIGVCLCGWTGAAVQGNANTRIGPPWRVSMAALMSPGHLSSIRFVAWPRGWPGVTSRCWSCSGWPAEASGSSIPNSSGVQSAALRRCARPRPPTSAKVRNTPESLRVRFMTSFDVSGTSYEMFLANGWDATKGLRSAQHCATAAPPAVPSTLRLLPGTMTKQRRVNRWKRFSSWFADPLPGEECRLNPIAQSLLPLNYTEGVFS
jgi:hypothetical protein